MRPSVADTLYIHIGQAENRHEEIGHIHGLSASADIEVGTRNEEGHLYPALVEGVLAATGWVASTEGAVRGAVVSKVEDVGSPRSSMASSTRPI